MDSGHQLDPVGDFAVVGAAAATLGAGSVEGGRHLQLAARGGGDLDRKSVV